MVIIRIKTTGTEVVCRSPKTDQLQFRNFKLLSTKATSLIRFSDFILEDNIQCTNFLKALNMLQCIQLNTKPLEKYCGEENAGDIQIAANCFLFVTDYEKHEPWY